MPKPDEQAIHHTPFAAAQNAPELRDYRLQASISQDELATVYAATHLPLDRPVQVHILRRTDWVSASRFQLAGRLAARLSHPNLLPVIDAGHDERYGDYLVTQQIEAQPLGTLLAQGPLDPLLAVRVFTQIGAALDYLHSQQVIHRDVQPANILLTPQGLPYLANLSLAASPDTPDLSSVDEADYLTPYSAPEQRLDQGEASPQLDIYSLGAVLFHMLSGEIPPAPEEERPALASFSPALAGVDTVLASMLALDPQQRFASAADAVVALRRAMRPHLDQAAEGAEGGGWEPTADWLENPLETVLGTMLAEYAGQASAEASQPTADADADAGAGDGSAPPAGVSPLPEALHRFEDFLDRSRARVDYLHRADNIRRLLNRWSRKGFFRRPLLGQIIELEQIISYTIYIYELHTLYETRTQPEERQRPASETDIQATEALPDVWEVAVPEAEDGGFDTVKPQELLLPNSTQIFVCPTCNGEKTIPCYSCGGRGTIPQTRPTRQAVNSGTDQTEPSDALPITCPTCHGYGKLRCDTCDGAGNLVEEAVFTWARRARIWHNTDDIEDLPRRALQERARPICSVPINPYAGHWHSVAPLNELLQAAIRDVQGNDMRIIAADLQLSGVPMTEVDYRLNGKAEHLYIIDFDYEIVGNWALFNLERMGLVAMGVLLLVCLGLVGLFWLL